jgi:phage shock protein E
MSPILFYKQDVLTEARMTKNSQQLELLELLEKTRRVTQTFISNRSAAEKSEVGTMSQWTAKDILANSTFWMEYMVERMAYYARHETPPRHVNFEALTQKAFEASQTRLRHEVVNDVERALNTLVSAVAQLTDEQLNINNVYGDISDENTGGPLSGEIRANGFICPLEDIEKFYIRTADTQQAAVVHALLHEAAQKSSVDLIQPQALRKQQEADDKPLIVDVRSAKEYAEGHVQGAVNIPLASLVKAIENMPHHQSIVTYCNMHHPGESRGERAALLLREKGCQAQALEGGFPGWKGAGFPIEELSNA